MLFSLSALLITFYLYLLYVQPPYLVLSLLLFIIVFLPNFTQFLSLWLFLVLGITVIFFYLPVQGATYD